MNLLHAKLLTIAAAGSLFFSNSLAGQASPYAPKAIAPPEPRTARVQISHGPELEIARPNLAIITWTTNNPGGTDVHYGIVHFGIDPKELTQTAKNPIHLNRSHPDTVFRVRIDGLSPGTNYYYTVESTGATGVNDGVKSEVKQFTAQ